MLSIITPVYNTADYLCATVDSILAQTYRNFELILVDDGSTDGSGELCDQLAAKDVRIRVIHKPNGGVASARNAGLDAVRGDYIGWVDSDDLISPVMFETMLKLAARHNADVVQCSHIRQCADLVLEPFSDQEPVEVLNKIDGLKRIYRSNYTNALALWSKIYRSELFFELRFTEGTAFEDDEIVPQILERSKRLVFFEQPLYCYTKREASIITAPKVKNIVALTNHLENRMLWFQALDQELYALSRSHFFGYLKGKTGEEVFCGTEVQAQAFRMLKKYYKAFWKMANRYDRVALCLTRCGKRGRRCVAQTKFEPLQSVISKIKGN